MQPLTCIARGRAGRWQAICLDFNIAAQGQSFDEVRNLLEEAVLSYVHDALKEPEPTRSRLLGRRTPLLSRLAWSAGLLWTAVFGRRPDSESGTDTTVPFAVARPA